MAKESGLGFTTLSVDDATGTPRDIRNDVASLTFSTPRAVQEVTGVDKSAPERLLLLADFSASLTLPAFNDTANMSHSVFRTVSSTSVARTVALAHSGQTLSNECIATDYALTRNQDGSLGSTVPLVLCDGTVPTWGT